MKRECVLILALLLAVGLAPVVAAPAFAETDLKIVMHSDLKLLDPIWSGGYITRNHGYMIYDTLFATDAAGEVRPQMLDRYDVSADKLIYTLTLREGLLWHDSKPVTAEDCIASLKRWGSRDTMGQKLMTFVKEMVVVDARTFRIVLKEPTGLVLPALGKPGVYVPFMMPKRVADTSPNDQISDTTGSGPFVFKREDWKPGDKVVYSRFAQYRPRPEPPSGLAGGKVARVDRVEWKAINDHQTAINALLNGEVDMIESPPHDLLAVLRKDANVKLINRDPLGLQYAFRFNTLHRPFDNVKIRQALWYAFNQEDFLRATIGDPTYYKLCKALFVCGTPLESTKGMDGLLESNFDKAHALIREARYDGTPVVLLHSTDVAVLTNLAPVAKSLMERAGLKVDMQSMDWQTLVTRVAKKEPPAQGGWNAFVTAWAAADILNPVVTGFLNASCDKAMRGWPCDAEIERLRDQYARETNPARLKGIAEAVQVRITQYPTHIHLGQWSQPMAVRRNVDGIVAAPVTVLWNIEKKPR
jgi:peptide/nickel transport system substrate-binding protein